MLDDSNAGILLTQGHSQVKYPLQQEVIDLNNPEIYQTAGSIPEVHSHPEDLAYLMYTSGSTGQPKGVAIERKNVVRLVKNTNYLSFEKTDRVLQTGSIAFDASTLEIWGSLLNGVSLYLIEESSLLDAKKLGEFLTRNRITIMWLTSPLFNQLSQEKPDIFRGVRWLLIGGDVPRPNMSMK